MVFYEEWKYVINENLLASRDAQILLSVLYPELLVCFVVDLL